MPRISDYDRLQEINRFFNFERYLANGNNNKFTEYLTQRCKRCLNSEKNSIINESGLCMDCVKHDELEKTIDKQKLEHKLVDAQIDFKAVVESYCGKGKNFDAIVLNSGGKDSLYTMQRLKNEFRELRLLSFTVDDTYMSKLTSDTAAMLAREVGCPHHIHNLDGDIVSSAFRYSFRQTFTKDMYPLPDELEGVFIFDIARIFAAENDIPLIFIGLSTAQVEGMFLQGDFESPKAFDLIGQFESPKGYELKSTTDVAGHPIDEFTKEISDHPNRNMYWRNPSCYDSRLPRVLYPFMAWGYDKTTVWSEAAALHKKCFMEILANNGIDSQRFSSKLLLHTFVSNSDVLSLVVCHDAAHLGFSRFEPEFSRLIRQNQLERSSLLYFFQAVEILGSAGMLIPEWADNTLGRLELTRKELGIPEADTNHKMYKEINMLLTTGEI